MLEVHNILNLNAVISPGCRAIRVSLSYLIRLVRLKLRADLAGCVGRDTNNACCISSWEKRAVVLSV